MIAGYNLILLDQILWKMLVFTVINNVFQEDRKLETGFVIGYLKNCLEIFTIPLTTAHLNNMQNSRPPRRSLANSSDFRSRVKHLKDIRFMARDTYGW